MALESFWVELAGIGHQSVKVTAAGGSVLRPQWFAPFLADRGTRKPSPHTMTASRQDFEAIAAAIVGDGHPVGTHEARLCQHAVRILI